MGACLRALCVALSIYSAIPVPQVEWNDRSLAWPFCFLPVVGVAIAALLVFWLWLCDALGLGPFLSCAFCVVIPLLVTGGIHMDGFCDTMDALCSHQDAARCLEIMKDSHSGAFAVIFCGAYLVANFGLADEGRHFPAVFCAIYVMSRAVSLLSVSSKKNARGSGMLLALQKPLHAKAVRGAAAAWMALAAAVMLWNDMPAGLGAIVACPIVWWSYHHVTKKRFGGITGDTSGFFVQTLELGMLIGMALCGALGKVSL